MTPTKGLGPKRKSDMKKPLLVLTMAAASLQAHAASYLETFQGMAGELCDPTTNACENDTPDHAFMLRWQNSPPLTSHSTTTGFHLNTGWAEICPYDPNTTMTVERLSFTINKLTAPAAYGTITLSIWDEATNSYIPFRNYTILPNRTKTVYYYTTQGMSGLKRFQLSATGPVVSFTINAMNADLN